MEYRIVRTNEFGKFKTFDDDYRGALRFLLRTPAPCIGSQHPRLDDRFVIEHRPLGGGPKDWAEVPTWAADMEALRLELIEAAQNQYAPAAQTA